MLLNITLFDNNNNNRVNKGNNHILIFEKTQEEKCENTRILIFVKNYAQEENNTK